LIKALISTPSVAHKDSFTRIHYVRYADDFVIGVEGSHSTAIKILDEAGSFIRNKLSLELNYSKTGITNYSITPVKFIGYLIYSSSIKGTEKSYESLKVGDRLVTRRKKIRIKVNMDYNKVLKRLQTNGFIKRITDHSNHNKKIYHGTFKGNFINLEHADIIRYYSSIMRGLYNYYNFVRNMLQLGHVL
jgi:hypothetical protein